VDDRPRLRAKEVQQAPNARQDLRGTRNFEGLTVQGVALDVDRDESCVRVLG
jgi:hypothetical protein